MKKFLLGFTILLILFCLVSSSAITTKTSFAQETSVAPASDDIVINNTENNSQATQAAAVEYSLPYAGILPDNPLYFLKAARDRIVSFLISDLQKKAEFNLLTADKRISSAWTLADRGKGDLAISTLSKSNNYMALSVDAVSEAKKSGRSVDDVLSNIKNSIRKHNQVLGIIGKEVGSKYKVQLQYEKTRLDNFAKSIAKLIAE